MHLRTDKIYVLNRTGARLWEHLAAGCDVTEIARRMLAEFAAPVDELTKQIDAMVDALVSHALINACE